MTIQRLRPATSLPAAEVPAPLVAMTIAGSDSGGGAGIQADLKTFAAFDIFGATAVTAVTAQNTLGVEAVHIVPLETVESQIRVVIEDLAPAANKTGMLANVGTIELVASFAANEMLPNLVVDPVMVATSGARLLDKSAEAAYINRLFPYATLVTPNAVEAGVFCGRELHTLNDLHDAANEISSAANCAVLIKGGHINSDESVDVFTDGVDGYELATPRTSTTNTHGTGCSLAAAIAAGLATGSSTLDAVVTAKSFIAEAIESAKGWALGQGHGPVDHFVQRR